MLANLRTVRTQLWPTAFGQGFALALLVLLGGCNHSPEQPTTPPTTVHGTEHLAWGQTTNGSAVTEYQFLAYVDGASQPLTNVDCEPTADAATFDCRSSLPMMQPGQHRLWLTTVLDANGTRLESAASTPFDVLYAPQSGNTMSVPAGAPKPMATADGIPFTVETLATGLDSPSGVAATPDGRVFVAERSGSVRVWQNGSIHSPPALQLADAAPGSDVGLVGLALDPDFAKTSQIFVAYTAREADGRLTNRVIRTRDANNQLGQTASILTDPTDALPVRTPRIAFGPDGKLYVAFPDNSPDAQDAASYSGKILRLNADGTTPRDNPRSSPIVSSDQGAAVAFAWLLTTGSLWQIDRNWDGREELRQVSMQASSPPPAFTFDPAIDPSAATFYGSGALTAFAGNLFVSTLASERIERIRFDANARVVATEHLVDRTFGRIGDIVAASDGALYFCTSNSTLSGQTASDSLVRIAAARIAR